MLAEFRDYIKTLNVAEHYSIGKIDNAKDKSLGIYGDSTRRRIEAIGKEKSYGIMQFRILLHWTKNLNETEAQARSLHPLSARMMSLRRETLLSFIAGATARLMKMAKCILLTIGVCECGRP